MDYWLPLIFVSLMGLSLLLYIILDGYDLGIGILLPLASDDEKDRILHTFQTSERVGLCWIVFDSIQKTDV